MNLSPIVEINSKLVKSNIEYLRNKNPHSKIMFIVKANAYGVGIENIYKVTNNLVDAYGIARIEEYYVLKSLGCTKDIIFLSGIYAECFDFKIPKNVIPILGNELLIKDYIKYEDDKSKQVMLDFDCGMGRFGFYKDDFIKHLYKLKNAGFSNITLFSHIPTGYNGFDKSKKYIDKILSLATQTKLKYTFSNSPVSLFSYDFQQEYIRPCSAILGYDQEPQEIKFSLALKACIISIRDIPKGQYISYANEYFCDRDTTVAILNIGYADGLGCKIHKDSYLIIKDTKCPILAINMDYLYIDISAIKHQLKILDMIELFGPNSLSLEQHASMYNITKDEALTKLNALRVKKIVC
ncbi:alanine racemase [Francisella tularensis subsp. novicida]|uniref:Alanine racemase n=2 Tax=Francisella tularensis TaxID=263 RepID=A0A6I4RNN2_FRATU|nr:alanine racemase [Francisella tularensis]ABK89222.1 alanine racemase [Francisella tularensis subsp. novicida U112]AJI61432.1 alanine racemase [Francisella tularensis subsp. novicida U112]APA82355.1 Alanine racemase [Francisella tularensis subsp. novicida PA10-7858]APC96006.1 alanine racemase [Francisella tularensis subsp. novicida]EDX19084.1 alanine racemase, C- domain family [Francisella tularensis subsp. novicida FTE]